MLTVKQLACLCTHVVITRGYLCVLLVIIFIFIFWGHDLLVGVLLTTITLHFGV